MNIYKQISTKARVIAGLAQGIANKEYGKEYKIEILISFSQLKDLMEQL